LVCLADGRRIESFIHQHEQYTIKFLGDVDFADALTGLAARENAVAFDLQARCDTVFLADRILTSRSCFGQLQSKDSRRFKLSDRSRSCHLLGLRVAVRSLTYRRGQDFC